MPVSIKTCTRAAGATFRHLPAVTLIILFIFEGALIARASEKEQAVPGELITEPSSTPSPAQPETEQIAPGEPITEPSSTPPPAQPETEQIAPENLLTAPSLTAPPAKPEEEVTKPKLPAAKELKYVDMLHSEIVRRLLASAVWLDSFFADTQYLKEVNYSYVRFRYEIFKEERAGVTYRPAVDFRLALPELEKKTNLVFSADPAEPAPGAAGAPVRTAAERFGTSAQSSVTAALQYIFKQDAQTSFLVRTGFQFVKLSPVILLAPRYRVLMPLDTWAMRFTQEVIWKSRGSWQSDTRFDFERPLPYELFFRTTIDGLWAAQKNGYAYSLAFSLHEPLTPTHALDYEWINSYNTYPTGEITEVALRVRYRHSFLRDWLFFELAPQVRFPRDANFDSTAGILFKFEMFFGKI
ncbi:MAG TPA: hypothetical protein VLG39_05255 [Nitrospirota bacterium]|nr:hypothetical protein [Nitrospirota bacterium]